MNIQTIAPYLGITGQALIDLDENKTGADDFAGELILFSAEVISAVTSNGDLPEFPDALKHGVSDKITGVSRASLMVGNSVLTFARFQVSGKAAVILKYANQAISQLLAGQTVPPAPVV
jgi:hypothetical protein